MKALKLSSLLDLACKKGTVKYEHTLSFLEKRRDEWGGFYGLLGKVKACWEVMFSNCLIVNVDLDDIREDLEEFENFREKEREKLENKYGKDIDRLEAQLARSQEKRNQLQSKVWDLQKENETLKKSIEIVSESEGDN